jgi:type VI secretion system protein ImpH
VTSLNQIERRDQVQALPAGSAGRLERLLQEMQAEPWRFDFFSAMRQLERHFRDRPRISNSASRREEVVVLGQDPYLAFPASNLSRVAVEDGRIKVFVRFLGLLGPQGALPLATTEESLGWLLMRDDAFARFLDIFNHRFLQLFFRAWADSRPVAQHDRPEDDRFVAYIGSMIGVGSVPLRNLDSLPDAAKLRFAGLIASQAKSASRLKGFIAGLFGVRVEIDEFVGSWLAFDAADRSGLGLRNSELATNVSLGASIFSVQDKIRVRVFATSMAQYKRFLPSGDLCRPLADAVFFCIGDQLDWELELAIPSGSVEPVELGRQGQIGWTTWMSPNWASKDRYRCDARFHPAERVWRQEKTARARRS